MRGLKVLSIIYFASLLLITSLTYCSKDKNPLNPLSQNNFVIYFLENRNLKYSDISTIPISKLKLSRLPVTSEKDIEFYKIFKFSEGSALSHSIKFNRDMKKVFGESNLPFLLVANQDRIYIGEYWANFMDTMGPEIIIYPYSNTEFHILSIGDGIEKINDARIMDALEESNTEIIYEYIGTN